MHIRLTALAVALTVAVALPAQSKPNDPKAAALVDRALTRLGGEAVLRSVTTARYDVMTQWQRTSFADHPYADAPSYERNVSLFDYPKRAWRNTRVFLPGTSGSVDIVRDSVGARISVAPNQTATETPLNIAYVDERRELFAFESWRTLLVAMDAGGLTTLPDTTVAGVVHARVRGTVDGFPSTWFLRRTDGLPSLVRFRADETNDFGLAPWGVQDVEIWWSGWGRVAPGVLIARQRDVRRVGRPYKRMTVLQPTLNAPAPVDSFAIADSIAAKYLATERRPMWNAPMDSARITENDFATFSPWVGTSGAVRIGGQWVLLETGQTAGAAAIVDGWLTKNAGGGAVMGIVTNTATSNGGATWFTAQKRALYAAPGAARLLAHVSSGKGATPTLVSAARWMKVGTDSLWLEPVDAPDAHGTLVVYSPALKWLYSPMLVGRPSTQVELDAVIARLKARGFAVEWLGGARGLRTPAPR